MELSVLTNVFGGIVYFSPKFVKNWLERLVFSEPKESLPSFESQRGKYDCVALVLGGCTGRPERALELYRERLANRIVTSGGIGPFSENQEVAEAELYRIYLLDHGVPQGAILNESYSTSTSENMQFSLPIIAKMTATSSIAATIIVTNHFHVKRSVILFNKVYKRLKREDSNIAKLKVFWASGDYPDCERDNWRETKKGCFLVFKEAIRIIQSRLSK